VVKFRQILLNLIGNACKFTTNGTVTVAAETFASSAGPQFRISVTDSGIGMTDEQIGRLFKPFSQADDSTTRKYGGTGLGLVLSQRFTQLLGGQISVSSQPGIGSQFVVTLPLQQKEGTIEVAERQALPARPALEPTYVLIIDDDPLTQELIGRQLSRIGVAWRAALNATDGLRMAREQTPMAITLDLLLPDQHGLSVLSTLKADPQLASVPVIVVSMLDDRSAGYALGASEYLVKPIDGARLVSMLGRLLPASGPRRILVVDDDNDARVVVARRAAEFGASVAQASNGEEALAVARAQRPDLVLLDLMMPVMDGFAVMDAMRDDPTLRDVPIVVVTARDMADDDLARLTGSVTALVHKQPYDQNAVMDEIGRLVASHARQHDSLTDAFAAPTSPTLH
jgi:CheY-like chemotaxis protein